MRGAALLLFLAPFGFAEEPPPDPPAPKSEDPHVLRRGTAPTPYTAAEIRAGCPDGRISLFRISGGGKVLLSRMRFGKGDGTQTRMQSLHLDEQKRPLGQPTDATVKWRDLQAHAMFDEKATTITEETVEVPFGRFPCKLYTIRGTKGIQRFWFAKDLPGPPVRMVVEVDGKVRQTMELIDHRSFDYEAVFGPQLPGKPRPSAWTAAATIADAKDDGPQVLRASLRGDALPQKARLRVTRGALKGAILPLSPRAGELAFETELPAGFRTSAGSLDVELLEDAPAK